MCSGHAAEHIDGPGYGHEAVTHGNHVDDLVFGLLHHPRNGHCYHHGTVKTA